MSKHILTMILLVHQSFMIFVSTLVLILLMNHQYTLYHAIDYFVVIIISYNILSPLFFLFVFPRAPLLVCLPNIIIIIIIIIIINHRRACAVRVTVVGSCVCVSVFVSLSHISLTERLFVLKTLSRTHRETKVKIFVGICLKRLRSRVTPRNMSEKANVQMFTRGQLSPLDIQRSARGYPTTVNNIWPCLKRCLLLRLTRVRARTKWN